MRTGVKVHGPHARAPPGTTDRASRASDTLEVDAVIVSVGRRPLSESLGLDGTGVVVDERGFVEVDELCRTAVDGVWAVGDLIATPGLAHVGYAEAILVIKQLLGEEAIPVDYGKVAWCIYCQPEVAFAGLSEQAAIDAGYEVVTTKHRWGGNSRALIVGDTEGVVKVIAEKRADGTAGQLLGVHMAGPVGHRAARPGLPGRQLGGHRRRHRPLHPAPPVAVGELRRGRAVAHRPQPQQLSSTPLPSRADPTPPDTSRRRSAHMADIELPPAGRERHRRHHHPVVQGDRRPGRRGRAAVRGVHRQGRLRGPVARRAAT